MVECSAARSRAQSAKPSLSCDPEQLAALQFTGFLTGTNFRSFKSILQASTGGPVTLGCFAGHVPTMTSGEDIVKFSSQKWGTGEQDRNCKKRKETHTQSRMVFEE